MLPLFSNVSFSNFITPYFTPTKVQIQMKSKTTTPSIQKKCVYRKALSELGRKAQRKRIKDLKEHVFEIANGGKGNCIKLLIKTSSFEMVIPFKEEARFSIFTFFLCDNNKIFLLLSFFIFIVTLS